MSDILWALFHVCVFPGGLFALGFALFLKGLDRRIVARFQRRVGPPLIQPLLDIAKLLTKETLIPRTACKSMFMMAPVIGMTGMADPWNRAPMNWDEPDEKLLEGVRALLLKRRDTPVLQTGYLEVEAVDADTLRITRCARDGKDVFGEPLAGKAAVVKVSRK